MAKLTSGLEENLRGEYSESQRKYLLQRHLTTITYMLLFLGAFSVQFFFWGLAWGFTAVVISCGIISFYIYNYVAKLWLRPTPLRIVGIVKLKVSGVAGGYGRLTINKLRLRGENWMVKPIQQGQTYEVFYTRKSKFLLSYRHQYHDTGV